MRCVSSVPVVQGECGLVSALSPPFFYAQLVNPTVRAYDYVCLQASCQQRAGRAGRVRPGHAFRLCSEEDYQELLPDASVPEMQRSDLSSLLLQLKVRSDKEGTEEGFFFGVRVKEGSSQR